MYDLSKLLSFVTKDEQLQINILMRKFNVCTKRIDNVFISDRSSLVASDGIQVN